MYRAIERSKMIRYLIALASFLFITPLFSDEEERSQEELFLSTPEQVATLAAESSYLVGGLISPLSGQLALRQTDLVVKGAQNIVLSRTYLPLYIPSSFPYQKHDQEEHDKRCLYQYLRNNYKGWQFYPHLRLEFISSLMKVRLAEPNGMTLDFRLSGPGFSRTSLASPPYAISNVAGDMPSGKYDLRNTRISYEKNGDKITIYAVDGTTRIYRKKGLATKYSYLYLLEKEILSSGKVLKYHYNERNLPYYIESLDPKERYVYSSLRMSGTAKDGNCHFISSSGLTVDYNYQRRPVAWKIKEKVKGRQQKDKAKGFFSPILTSVSSPFYRQESLDYCGRFLLSSYSGKEDIFTVSYAGFGEEEHYRIHKLDLPVGQNDSFQSVYELSYSPPVAGQKEGTTVVKNNDGTSIVYHFSKNLLTTLIQYLGQEGELKKEKAFSWDNKNWLQSLEIRDGQKNILYRKTYEYDRFGNPVLEVFSGDLTGEGNLESFTTKRTFSEDGRNLLLNEETEDGKIISFSYLPNTDLITSKLTKDGAHIILREFSIYDDCNNLVQTISDDGSSEDKDNLSDVSQQTLKTYTLRGSAPFLHMPEWIEETYLENGTYKLLKKSHLVYDEHGNIAQEEVYDAEGKLAYTICKTYNERGDILSETSRLGQEAAYTYDARGRFESSLNFSHRLQTTFHHDTKGRLKTQIKTGDDGVVHKTSAEYDFYDRKIQETDSFQNTTYYTYDPLVSRVIKSDFPTIASIEGQAVSVSTSSSYDPFGRENIKTDANGNSTTYRYNAYGSPTEVIHPNGGREVFRYTKNGWLISYTDLDGLTTCYKRDVLGRVLSKAYVSSDGKALAEETFTYNGFNLLTETDKEGNLKQYAYDGAGRKIREDFCGRITDFIYDALGWLAATCQHNGDNTLLIHYKRDLEGRVLEKFKTDTSGQILYKISYSYDGDSNQETITRYINGKQAIQMFAYDSFCRLIQHQDAEGFITRTTYNENFTNLLGQKVLQTTTIDPRHISTLETQDALMRTAKAEILNSQEVHIASYELIHDPQGNLLYRRDHVYENGHFQNTQTIKYSYTSDHQIESLTRGFGTEDARTTVYTYFPSGKMATKTLPDGVTLTYSYHPLGFMSRLDSSDGKIQHAFDYNLLGYLKYAVDEKQGITISRQVDPFGNVLQEILPYDLEIKKDYDDFNRLTLLKIRDQGEILYAYDPLFLRKIIRASSGGDILYSHTYEKYDEDGNPITENLIGNLGNITHEMDLRGYSACISSPYFSEQCRYDAVGNLISNITDGIEGLYSYDELSQLSSENNASQSLTYTYDSLYNRTQKNGKVHGINILNELLAIENNRCFYDLNGNQISKQTPSGISHFIYDPLNRLIEVVSEKQKLNFIYDPLGRRLSKTVYTQTAYGWKETDRENYLYDDQYEIGALSPTNKSKNLRVLGFNTHKNNPITVSVELEGRCFASILDVQNNIRGLVDMDTRTVECRYDCTAFGEEVQTTSHQASLFNPWRFASKRLDPESGLIYFGKRFYDPLMGRWLSVDPAGFVDSVNLYQYLLNNPFYYFDPDGQEAVTMAFTLCGASQAGGLSLAALMGPVGWVIGGSAILTAIIAWKGPEIVHKVNNWMDHKAENRSMNNETVGSSNSPKDPEKEKNEKKTPGNLQKQIEQGKAPKSADRADKGRGPYEKDHLHFKDGAALNSDGTWKHGERELTKQEIEWLQKNGWKPSS